MLTIAEGFKMKTETKLTLEKLTISQAMLYPNAEIKTKTSYFKDVKEFLHLEGIAREPLNISDCKLQLRPLSDLTKSESFEIFMLMGVDSNLGWTKKETVQLLSSKTLSFEAGRKLTDYLRSINIYSSDLPEGTYILETTINQNHTTNANSITRINKSI